MEAEASARGCEESSLKTDDQLGLQFISSQPRSVVSVRCRSHCRSVVRFSRSACTMRLARANLCAFLVCLLSIIGSGCANEAVHSMHELEPFFSHKTPPWNADEVPLEDEGVQEDESPALFAEAPQIALFEKHSSGDVVRVLGIESEGSVCCVSSKPGRVDCFIRGPWSNVLHMSVENGVYSDWDNLGGWITGDIDCVSRKEDFVDILSTDSANHIMVKQYTDGEWSEWQKGTDIVMETPSCVVRTSEVVECVVLHINARLYRILSTKGTFSLKIQDLGSFVLKRPTYGSSDEKSTTPPLTQPQLGFYMNTMIVHLNRDQRVGSDSFLSAQHFTLTVLSPRRASLLMNSVDRVWQCVTLLYDGRLLGCCRQTGSHNA